MLPAQQVYLDALASWSSLGGPMVRGELGARLGGHLGVFSYAQWSQRETVGGVGARLTF